MPTAQKNRLLVSTKVIPFLSSSIYLRGKQLNNFEKTLKWGGERYAQNEVF